MKNGYDFNGKTILIADDDSTSILLAKAYLNDTGANVLTADNGKTAVDLVSKGSIDIVLMDIKLPIMDGYEATKRIREYNKSIPIIAYTSYAMVGDAEKSIANGCTDHLSKPVFRDKMLETLDKYLSN